MQQKVYAYIIRSDATGDYYTDLTVDLETRLKNHNRPGAKQLPTDETPGPWHLEWSRACETRSEALQLVRMIEDRKIAKFLASRDKG